MTIKDKALCRLVKRAVEIIQEERQIAHDSFTDVNGRITNIDERAIVRNFDRWLKDARVALGKKEAPRRNKLLAG